MFIEVLTFVLVGSYVVFLILGLTIRARWRDRFASGPVDIGGSTRAGTSIILVKPSGQLVDQGWITIAGLFAGGIIVLTMMGEEPDSLLAATGWAGAVAALVVLPWIGLVLNLGHCYALTEDGITRSAPFTRDRSIKWRDVRNLRYDQIIRGGFVLSDDVNSFTIDVMVKNGRSFLQYSIDKVPIDVWDRSAVDEAEARMRSSKAAGPHMVTSARRERL